MGTRIFTPSTARASLSLVRPRAEYVFRLFRLMERFGPSGDDSDGPVEPAYFRMVLRLVAELAALHESGVQVDPRNEMVDFPARRAGRDVLLCWKVGEPGLDHWHDSDPEIEGRFPVDDDGPWE
jgi:hypothetical protein